MPLLALGPTEIALIVVAVIVLAFFVVLALNYKKVGPNQVLIVSGGFRKRVREADGPVRKVGYKLTIGGGAFVTPLFQS
jgi:flotillin